MNQPELSISEEQLEALWQRLLAIVRTVHPRETFRREYPHPAHPWKPSRYWREGVETSPGFEAYPGCIICGAIRKEHP